MSFSSHFVNNEEIEMKEIKNGEASTSILELHCDVDSGTLTSRKRHGWAPPKETYQNKMIIERPVSLTGTNTSCSSSFLCDYMIRYILIQRNMRNNRYLFFIFYLAFHSESSTADSSVLGDGIGRNTDISSSWAAELNLNQDDSDARLYEYLFCYL